MSLSITAERAADLLVQSRRDNTLLADLPEGLIPHSIDEAYAVQDATLRLNGPAGGWKIAAKPDSDPRCSVISANAFVQSGATLDVPPQGFDAEIETAFVFAQELPKRDRPYTQDEVAQAIGAVHLAIELVAARFADRRSLPALTRIADLQGNAGVVLGAGRTDWTGLNHADLPVSLSIDGAVAALPRRNIGLEDTLQMLTWLANHAVTRNVELKAGHAVITGARLGPVPLGVAREIVAECPELGVVAAKFRKTDSKGE
ncbi:MAG: hypothetical protein ABNH26_13575 [Celeribacter sp.]|jgi:2-keto-4-pentenoate hydratase